MVKSNYELLDKCGQHLQPSPQRDIYEKNPKNVKKGLFSAFFSLNANNSAQDGRTWMPVGTFFVLTSMNVQYQN